MTSVAAPIDPIKAIRDYADSVGYKPDAAGKYRADDDAAGYSIYSHASTKGFKADDLDTAFGWDRGTSANWVKSKNLAALNGPTPAPAPAPSAGTPTPSPSPAPATTGGGIPAAGSSTPSIMERAMSGARTAVNSASPAPAPYQGVASRAGQAAQTQWDENMSAAGRLNSILRQGGPLMEAARNRGNQAAAARGMVGSTMGIEAAQKAMIESATPLAQTDASLYSQAQNLNTQQRNQWDLTDAQLQQSDRQFGANLAEGARQANLGATTQLSVAGMNYDIQDKRLSSEEAQFLKSLDLENKKLDTAIAQFEKQFGLDLTKLSQQDRQYYDGLKLEKDKLTQQADQFNRDWENKFSLENMAAKNRIDLANIDATNKERLMGIEAAYKKEIASNETISNAWGTMMQEIGKIQNNPELEEGAKATLINNYIGQFTSFTNFWKKVSGGTVDVSDLLSIRVAGPAPAAGGSGPATSGNGGAGADIDYGGVGGGVGGDGVGPGSSSADG